MSEGHRKVAQTMQPKFVTLKDYYLGVSGGSIVQRMRARLIRSAFNRRGSGELFADVLSAQHVAPERQRQPHHGLCRHHRDRIGGAAAASGRLSCPYFSLVLEPSMVGFSAAGHRTLMRQNCRSCDRCCGNRPVAGSSGREKVDDLPVRARASQCPVRRWRM